MIFRCPVGFCWIFFRFIPFDWMKLFLKADNSAGHSGGFLHAGSVNDRHSYLEQLSDMCGMRTWFTCLCMVSPVAIYVGKRHTNKPVV